MSDDKLKFPMAGDEVCPICGCKERIGHEFITELKREGKLSNESFPKNSFAIAVALFDPTHPPLAANFTIPIVQILFDVCKDNRHIYCTGIDVIYQEAEAQSMPQQKLR